MGEVKIQYAQKNGITYNVNDDFVKTGDKGFTFDGMNVYPAKGKKKSHHFRSMPGAIIAPDRIFHVNCQNYIKETKRVELDDCIIEAHTVLLEHEAKKFILNKIDNYEMIPDCLFLDENDKIICIVEVNVTHAKSEDDLIKINEYKIPTLELTYGKTKDNYKKQIYAEWLFNSGKDDSIRADIERTNREIETNKSLEIECREFIEIQGLEIEVLEREIEQYQFEITRLETKVIETFKESIWDLRKKILNCDFIDINYKNLSFCIRTAELTCYKDEVDDYVKFEFLCYKKRIFLIITDNYPITNEIELDQLQEIEHFDGTKSIPTTFIVYLEQNGNYKTDVIGNLYFNFN